MFLSQSTGLTKKFNDRGVENGLEHGTRPVPTDSNNGNGVGSISSHSESANGISFKAKPIDKIAEPITTAKTVETINSYQPNQTIFNNLQRRQPKQVAMSTAATEKAEAAAAAAAANTVATNDFQTFLKNSNTANSSGGHENRTQQRLWLQRENSLMDVPTIDPTQLANFSSLSLNNLMFSHQGMTPLEQPQQSQYQQAQTQLQQLPLLLVQLAQTPGNVVTPGVVGAGGAVSDSSASLYGLLLNIQSSHQNSIQSRTEFERLNREYLNVRRHLNPVGESLNRTQEYFNSASINQKVTKARSKQAAQSLGDSITNPSTSANTFKEFSPTYQEKESEINQLVSKMWQGALISSSSSASSSSNASPLRVSTQNQLSGLLQQLQGYPGQLGAVQHVGGGGGGGGIGGQTSQLVAGRPSSQRLQSYSQSNYLRSPQTPTTRAVKLAASGSTSQQQFKKNDHLVNLA